jgi:hypothetical protein
MGCKFGPKSSEIKRDAGPQFQLPTASLYVSCCLHQLGVHIFEDCNFEQLRVLKLKYTNFANFAKPFLLEINGFRNAQVQLCQLYRLGKFSVATENWKLCNIANCTNWESSQLQLATGNYATGNWEALLPP